MTPPEIEPAAPEDEAARRLAETAASELVGRLEEIEATCREQWFDGAVLCAEPSFDARAREIASAYVKHHDGREDPRRHDGRIDALPRLGGPSHSEETIHANIRRACEERCDVARRGAIADRRADAVRACSSKSEPAACKSLAKYIPAKATLASVRDVVSECQDACDQALQQARADAAARRPTQAQRESCLHNCRASCSDSWCGTCVMDCQRRWCVR